MEAALKCIFFSIETVDGFILVGTNFRGLNKNGTFVGLKNHDYSIFFEFIIHTENYHL